MLSLAERLERQHVRAAGGCWLWIGRRDRYGYGKFRVDGVERTAHRVVYEHLVGPVPDDLELDHLCRIRLCVNPAHLEPVTHLENTRRAVQARRAA